MKPFNLARAIAGDPLITRDGRTDVVFGAYNPKAKCGSVVVWIKGILYTFRENGRWGSDHEDLCLDLFMAPKKRTVWERRLIVGDGTMFGRIRDDRDDQNLADDSLLDCDAKWLGEAFSFEIEE
jgi:hypothetical protein